MDSQIPKLLSQLDELGLFECYLVPFVTDDKKVTVFFNKATRLISICENGGDLSRILPGMVGGGDGFNTICRLCDGSVTWTSLASDYDTKFVEGVLTEIIAVVSSGKPKVRLENKPSTSVSTARLPIPRGHLPRSRFGSDTEAYIAHLEHVIRSGGMTGEEFLTDPRAKIPDLVNTGQPLRPAIDAFAKELAIISVKGVISYIPHPDEPSPFGPDREGYVDNAWIVWRYRRPDYHASRDGSAPLLREALLEELRDERYRSQADRELVPFELLTSDGKLSLGYVIHMRYSRQMGWEEAHAFGLNKIKELNQTR